jgi:hypothetical protein
VAAKWPPAGRGALRALAAAARARGGLLPVARAARAGRRRGRRARGNAARGSARTSGTDRARRPESGAPPVRADRSPRSAGRAQTRDGRPESRECEIW